MRGNLTAISGNRGPPNRKGGSTRKILKIAALTLGVALAPAASYAGNVRLVHNLERRWFTTAVGSWLALWLFASISLPLKYPYEARGQVVDSGVVIGLLVPLAVMNVVLYEGPADSVRTAARRLVDVRLAVCLGYFALAALSATAMAWAVSLPVQLVLADALLLGALNIAGTALLGVRLGWTLAALVAFTMSAPGLVPFEFNAFYHRDVGSVFLAVVAVIATVATLLFIRTGATGVRPARLSSAP